MRFLYSLSLLFFLMAWSCASNNSEMILPFKMYSRITQHALSKDSIDIHLKLINIIHDTITIRDGNQRLEFTTPSGWKQRELSVFDYDGPGMDVVSPGDSAVYSYSLNYFFPSMASGKTMLRFKYIMEINGQKKALIFADSVIVNQP